MNKINLLQFNYFTFLVLILSTESHAASPPTPVAIGIVNGFFFIFTVGAITYWLTDIYYRGMKPHTNDSGPTEKQIKRHAFFTWFLLIASLFLPWIIGDPYGNTSGSGLIFGFGLLVAIASSVSLGILAFLNRNSLRKLIRYLGFSPIIAVTILILVLAFR